MESNIEVLPGDDVGPAATTPELNVLQGAGEKFGHSFNLNARLAGGVAIDTLGRALSYGTLCVIAELEKGIIWKRIQRFCTAMVLDLQ